MRALLVCALACSACSPITVRGRVLPPALEVSPTAVEPDAKREPGLPPEHFLLASGVDLWVAREPGAQLLVATAIVGCGRVDDALESAGLTSLTFDALFEAGAGELRPNEQVLALGKVGAIEVETGISETQVSIEARTRDLPKVAQLLADALRAPRFEEEALGGLVEKNVKSYATDSARHQQTRRVVVARALFGASSPLSTPTTADSLRKVTRDAVVRQHARCVHPKNVSLAVSGDVDPVAVRAAFAALEQWPAGPAPRRATTTPAPAARRLFLVPSRVSERVTVDLVGPGLAPGDRAAAYVFKALLDSWLWYELRANGKAYFATTDIDFGPTAMTWVRFSTRRELAITAVRRALAIINGWWEHWPFTSDSVVPVSGALANWANAASGSSVAVQAAVAQREGGTAATPDEIGKVSMQDIREVFVKTLRPDRLQIIVSGDLPGDADWSEFAPVTRIDTPP